MIDGYQELAIVEQTDRDELIQEGGEARRQRRCRPTRTRAEAWAAVGKAGQKALDKDEKADAPHERQGRSAAA